MAESKSAFILHNVPYMNARLEFEFLLRELENPAFVQAFHAGKVATLFGSYEAQPHELATDLMRRSILGIESYVVGAVRITAMNANRWSEALEEKLTNPFGLKGRGAIEDYYNKVPALLSETSSLEKTH